MALKTPKFLLKIHRFLDSIHLPVLEISLWKMFEIYGQGVFKNNVVKQAASISWSFFLSIFPFLLFLLSILPYMPHYDKLQFYIFEVFMANILPTHMLHDVTEYIQNSIIPNMKSISKLTILFALVFATNGTFSLINGFNEHTDSKRTFIREYTISILVTLAFVTLIFLSLFGIYYSEVVLKLFTPKYNLNWLIVNLSKIIGFISFPLFYFILLSLFYWVGCVKVKRWLSAVPGAVLTTLLFVLITYGFIFYAKNFARYNVLYGSIGTIILAMIWVNLNIILILLGNELNLAIDRVKRNKLP
ncbi:YihY/virulence factor BrkB family protein [Riemerella anatipestifer]|uniref:YihY/virulence factor BrkB family protein n=1 Tax=Riemerella anatipestifer TaxID=34085 RepID=UPI001372595B|nr:YihY/virulence factor BrkB family protein [Riemerella anatipestifer]MBT0548479.1 YihY/virulence factor BrkB family protein [Riemerella anatipestifer]MBT0555633.1 YihY/virulence factor BrkB family protein [Riemerella anatipestifer]MBT0559242.1 YihY/virulence factor BrkB family protein [Riemerella anatipestifer]MCD5967683.1 YihY/virulence factor BrkB family protein [Riemerella anatipestifer]MDY3524978.1 YihY/virulence factor BrkB family protein [Riemerella anatipestifer]